MEKNTQYSSIYSVISNQLLESESWAIRYHSCLLLYVLSGHYAGFSLKYFYHLFDPLLIKESNPCIHGQCFGDLRCKCPVPWEDDTCSTCKCIDENTVECLEETCLCKPGFTGTWNTHLLCDIIYCHGPASPGFCERLAIEWQMVQLTIKHHGKLMSKFPHSHYP